ncbi:protein CHLORORESPIRATORY REDUCTION 42, chloroplastic [Phragmites australis]|uniref:protein CHLORORESPIRATORY REDUCTION 42, chloroplastic n=1 Tax=Phragmites australis TaxID=29695 RepID=UPI002D79D075|nr:protein CHLORORESPIRATORY REDUCTION 42, chloroplastic [Phragmites australis]
MLRQILAAATAAVYSSHASPAQVPASPVRRRPGGVAVRCAPSGGGGGGGGAPAGDKKSKLKVGSPIVILEAPTMLKTAASVPSLRHNSGQVKAGDVGRVMARKPKDVWAVRLAVGTYLLDGKFFRPLDVVDEDGDESPDE